MKDRYTDGRKNTPERRRYLARAVTKRRRKIKQILVAEHGGSCVDCGESYPDYVMQFDHRNPKEKEFGIGSGNTIALEKIRCEAEKCDLVCANCHAERTAQQRGYSARR